MFVPGDLSTIVRSRTNNLVDLILRQKVDILVDHHDSRIARSVEWLLSTQRSNGSWGVNNVAVTALVMLAFANLMEPFDVWDLEGEVKIALEGSEDFLLERYRENRFENALWDTAVAVRALKRTGQKSQSFISDRISWMLGLHASSVNAGPHHFAQKTLTFAECGVQMQSVLQAAEECLEAVEGGRYRFSPYVLAQCLEAAHVAQLESRARPLVDSLISFLENTHLDSANFINICSALNALAPIRNPSLERRMRLSVASLFGETCFRDDGTWYHDEMLSAYALIALTRFSKEIVIRSPKSELVYDVSNLSDEIVGFCDDYSNQSWRWWVILMASSFVSGALLLFFITYTTLVSNVYEWLKWLVGTIIPLVVGFNLRYAYKYYKKVQGSTE